MSDAARISPTAHYTGQVWVRGGLSHPALATAEGRLFYASLQPTMALSAALGGESLQDYLLARHRAIDACLAQALTGAGGPISQVLELACGLSPRGWRFTEEHGGDIDYVEADLPAMAARKRAALDRAGSLDEHHRVAEVDVLRDGGPGSLDALAATLDPERGLAIITEGLLGYLDTATVRLLLMRIAATLHRFPAGLYLSDLHTEAVQNARIRAFRLLLSAFVRGGVHLHFADGKDARVALAAAGFDGARVRTAAELVAAPLRPKGGQLVHIIEASTTPPSAR